MQAKDIMRKKVITVTPRMTLNETAKILVSNHISGAPVVGPNGDLIGVISQTDLVRRERDAAPREVPKYHREAEEWSLPAGYHIEEPDDTRVEQEMTPWAISFEENTPIEELARQMLSKHIHRVVITRNGKISGIVTTMDMIRALLCVMGQAQPVGRAEARPE